VATRLDGGVNADPRALTLAWYDKHQRDLPWRREPEPYAVWVSEIMLQQTRVETVIPYFLKFMERFPTPGALASASEDEVMSAWSGLGYYRRARYLHLGAKAVVERHAGLVPAQAKARRALPGVGRYTAGAIGSIAFDRQEGIVDGNVSRVFARLHGIQSELGEAVTEKLLWKLADAWAQGTRPGDANQALMELGALVCTPRSPKCDECPIARSCAAKAQGVQLSLPRKKKKRAPRPVSLVCVVPTNAGRVWLRRSEGPLFRSLWLPPFHVAEDSLKDRASALALLKDCGLSGRLAAKSEGRVEHTLSHRQLSAEVFRVVAVKGDSDDEFRSFARDEIDSVGIPSFARKLLKLGRFQP